MPRDESQALNDQDYVCDHDYGRHKNCVLTLLATLPTIRVVELICIIFQVANVYLAANNLH